MDGKTDFLDTTLFTMYVNIFTGLWCINVDKLIGSSALKRFLQVFAFLSDLLVFLNGFFSFIRLASVGVPIAERCIGFLTTATIWQSSLKCIYMVLRREKFQRFCDIWNKSFLNAPFKQHEKSVNLIERRTIKIITISMLAIFATPGVPWCFLPFSPVVQEMHGGKFMAVPLWMPFDMFKSPANEILLTLQAINAWFIVSKLVAFDCFFFSLVALEVVELKHLRYTIRKIFEDIELDGAMKQGNSLIENSNEFVLGIRPQKNNINLTGYEILANRLRESRARKLSMKSEPSAGQRAAKDIKIQRNRIKSRLALWVKHHQEVLYLGEFIKDLFYPMIMIQYVTTTLMMCFTAFVVTSVHLAFIQTVICTVFCGSITCQLFLLCHFGDRLASESLAVADACFSSGWHNHDIKDIQSSMRIIVLRAQKPMRITFFGLFPLNSETFSNVMQGAISYLMILLKVTEND